MKHKIATVLFMLLALCLSACSKQQSIKNEKYTIFHKDGKCYIEFHIEFSPPQSQQDGFSANIALSYPEFNSIEDMRQRIQNGDLSDGELYALSRMGTAKTVEIVDIWNLSDVYLPESLSYDKIIWAGSVCSFEFFMGDEPCSVQVCTKETFDTRFEEDYTNVINNPNRSIMSDTTISERNARAIHYMNPTGIYKEICYSLSSASKKVTVLEHYTQERYNAVEPEVFSDSIPDLIKVFGTDNSSYYYTFLRGFTERPSEEWLLAIEVVCTQ